MPNLPTSRSGFDQQVHEDVFPPNNSSAVAKIDLNPALHPTVKPKMVSVGVSTDDLPSSSIQDQPIPNVESSDDAQRKTESVVIQKKSFNCTGIDFGIGGIYVKDIDSKEISFKKGVLSVGEDRRNYRPSIVHPSISPDLMYTWS